MMRLTANDLIKLTTVAISDAVDVRTSLFFLNNIVTVQYKVGAVAKELRISE